MSNFIEKQKFDIKSLSIKEMVLLSKKCGTDKTFREKFSVVVVTNIVENLHMNALIKAIIYLMLDEDKLLSIGLTNRVIKENFIETFSKAPELLAGILRLLKKEKICDNLRNIFGEIEPSIEVQKLNKVIYNISVNNILYSKLNLSRRNVWIKIFANILFNYSKTINILIDEKCDEMLKILQNPSLKKWIESLKISYMAHRMLEKYII